ncbi:hypothetical protein EG68_01111 [Paragonimus skrjabini miyazakii]|uniref:Uncharacterized protein n=1 Tax=Paragonimus skrjabini miyazakii TaxID=59628 RepID=A0A8S9ZCB2_9TREM|nr:hypothetical protein EG68_01111 [Paragonimus skrjabini miyazakii]
MVNDNLEPTYDVTKQSCVAVNQAPGAVQYIPVWDQLHGPAHYKVYNSEKDEHAFAQLTVLTSDRAVTTSTFRCQLYEGGTCHSKLWLYSHIRPVLPIRLRPLDRLQTFFGSLTCDLSDVPANMLCVQLQVQWGLRAFVIVSNNKANWARLDRTSRRFLLSCQASACYMERVYGQQTEQMLVHVTATVQLNFNPTRDVYWQTDKLTCEVNNSDRKVQPYMVVVTYPINFRPRLSYKTIHFQEFIPGEYEIKCYYFGPSLGKRMLLKNVHVALPPTNLKVEHYMTTYGRVAMRCLDNGYPLSDLQIQWIVPDGLLCCEQTGSDLVVSEYAIHGVYTVRCEALVKHPLITVGLSTNASFIVFGTNFYPETAFLEQFEDVNICKVIVQLVWVMAYLAMNFFTILTINRERRLKISPMNVDRRNVNEFVTIPTGDMSWRCLRTFVQLITGYDAVAQLVCILVRQSRNTEHPFVLHDFDWTMRVRSRTLMRPDLSLTKERTDSDHSFKPTVIFIPPTSLKQLHRVHSQGISSIPSISSLDLTPENSDSARQGEEVPQQLTLVSLQKNQSPQNKQIEAEYDEGNAKPDGLVIRHRKKKKRCKRALTVPDYLRREVVRMMMVKRIRNDRKQKSKNGS